ncbi:histidinol-phosphate transaminase [Sphingomonas sp. LaA6.9]|uniref:pyridoxal phosphate-dependent aminotransferase n=1 Tax=Sphingomonas sp. LaA6.9 TaxID=2919914 RepID=UPI001F4F79C9|nr:histidinol-phosphate transaminase [Sphingomonas sp. LaA6.9]MCJ8158726.1 aminotransferase class I/II-fold pyridoxal phosphate-dependent enzyme [Sphingomonas sp. LaA6.9]
MMPKPQSRTDAHALPLPLPGIAGLAPYRQGKATLSDVAEPLKLSSNESMLGPSPRAIAAYQACSKCLHLYPDGSQQALRAAIGEVHGLDADRIVCGNGSDELIQLLIRAYVGPGDDVVISQYSFAMAFVHAIAQGANAVSVAEPQLRPDVDALLAALTPATKMVVIASPNNPVGQYLPRDELLRLHAGLPGDVILHLDSAYADYVEAPDYEAGATLVGPNENVVMTRTFSKLYGLAGLRIGWMYAPTAIIDMVQRIRTPFNANAAALAAAEAAVRDTEYAEMVREENRTEFARISTALTGFGIEVVPSAANFYLIRFPMTGRDPVGAAQHLESQGIIPRPVNTGPEAWLRISIGRPQQNDRVIAALQDYIR